jgi:integrase
MRVKHITGDAIRRFKGQLLEQGYSKNTINGMLMILTGMISQAVKDGKLSAHEAPTVEKFAKRLTTRRSGYISHGEFQRLQAALPEHFRHVVIALYETGCRKEEILGLTWGNVSITGKNLYLYLPITKNGEPRYIPLIEQDETLHILRELRRRHPHALDTELVFVNRHGKHINNSNKMWNRACVKAGIIQSLPNGPKVEEVVAHFEKDGTYIGPIPHDLRRSYARSIQEAGIAASVGQQLTGHLDAAMFKQYAGGYGAEQLRDARAKRLEFLKAA